MVTLSLVTARHYKVTAIQSAFDLFLLKRKRIFTLIFKSLPYDLPIISCQKNSDFSSHQLLLPLTGYNFKEYKQGRN